MWNLLGAMFVAVVVGVHVSAIPPVVYIGGIFNPENNLHQDVAFKYAVDRINMDKSILPHTTLVPLTVTIAESDSFNTGKRVCNLTADGVAAIFGPHSAMTAGIVRSISDTVEVPNLETHWEPEAKPSRCSLNLHPEPHSISKALAGVLTRMLYWKSFVILYEEDEGLVKLQEVLKAHQPSDNPVTVRQVFPHQDNRPLLKDIQASAEVHIILDCAAENVLEYLKQAREVNMFGEYISYFLTSLDAHTVDLSEFKDILINITTVRIVDPNSHEVVNAVEDWKYGESRIGQKLNIDPGTVKMETALMYDAVNLFAKSLHQLDSGQHISMKRINCNHVERWQHGFSLRNYMKLMHIQGMTGVVKFDEEGRRTDFHLDVIEYSRDEYKKIAEWDLQSGVVGTRTTKDIEQQVTLNLQNKTFIVSSRIGPPYLQWKQPREGRVGNDRFEGYSIDLITMIAEILKFKFRFELTADGQYGSYSTKTRKWNGLIKDLLEKKADLALCDLTITYDRENAVDFTMPFLNLGISILYSKPTNHDPSLFSFLDPLSIDVWLYMVTAYLGVSVLLFILARVNPNEWSNPHPCNAEPEELESKFDMLNSMWVTLGSLMGQGSDILPTATPSEWSSSHPCLTEPDSLSNKLNMMNSLWHNVGSLMQQGSDIAPQAVSTRAVAAMWWFFSLIMISSYTANLAASLTVTRMDATIESVEDLAKQNKIKYGVVKLGSTSAFFQKSNHSLYKRMWTSMTQTRPSVFVNDNSEGVERVKKGKGLYAFFMESTQIEYETERNCNLTKIGGQLDSKSYGIAMPLDSPYRTLISGAVLQLQEKGELRDLKKKWWKDMYGGGSCNTVAVVVDSNELGMANVGGVFLVLMIGCSTALVVALLEMLWNCRKIAVQEAITPWEALILELKFLIRMSETKPVRKNASSQPDKNESSSFIRLDFDKFPNK